MPQLQLPIFPAGVTEINSQIAVQKEAGRVCYLHGHLPVFQHEEQDVRSFRMFTSQMIDTGTVKPKEIVQTFGVPMVTVKRYVRLYRDHGAKGFYEPRLLQAWRLAARQIGLDLGHKRLKDEEIIVLLGKQRSPTFFTPDAGFYDPTLRHRAYCLECWAKRSGRVRSPLPPSSVL
jgi:hypothetical protein